MVRFTGITFNKYKSKTIHVSHIETVVDAVACLHSSLKITGSYPISRKVFLNRVDIFYALMYIPFLISFLLSILLILSSNNTLAPDLMIRSAL